MNIIYFRHFQSFQALQFRAQVLNLAQAGLWNGQVGGQARTSILAVLTYLFIWCYIMQCAS